VGLLLDEVVRCGWRVCCRVRCWFGRGGWFVRCGFVVLCLLFEGCLAPVVYQRRFSCERWLLSLGRARRGVCRVWGVDCPCGLLFGVSLRLGCRGIFGCRCGLVLLRSVVGRRSLCPMVCHVQCSGCCLCYVRGACGVVRCWCGGGVLGIGCVVVRCRRGVPFGVRYGALLVVSGVVLGRVSVRVWVVVPYRGALRWWCGSGMGCVCRCLRCWCVRQVVIGGSVGILRSRCGSASRFGLCSGCPMLCDFVLFAGVWGHGS
jgi:hypothetical protein